MFVEVLSRKVKVRDKNGTRTVSKLEAMIEVVSNKGLAGDPHAFARIIQTAEKLDAFNWQPEETIDPSAYEVLMRRLEEMGYDTGRRPSTSVAPRAKLAAE
jgi:Family of unknown function (DUF5681)